MPSKSKSKKASKPKPDIEGTKPAQSQNGGSDPKSYSAPNESDDVGKVITIADSETKVEEMLLEKRLHFCPIQEGTDLRAKVLKSRFREDPSDPKQWTPKQFAHKFPTNFSSFAVLKGQEHQVGTTDFIGDSENIKKLLQIPCTNHSASLILHRIGNSLLVDQFDMSNVFEKSVGKPMQNFGSGNGSWEWFNAFVKEIVKKEVIEEIFREEKNLPKLVNKHTLHNIFHYGLASDIKFKKSEPKKLKQSPSGPALTLEGSQTNFLQKMSWNFLNFKMLVGSQVPVFEVYESEDDIDRNRNNSSNVISDSATIWTNDLTKQAGVTEEAGIEMWLDNLMLGAKEALICHQENHIVKRNEYIQTFDIPKQCGFQEDYVRKMCESFLSNVQKNTQCTGHSYWLFKAPMSYEFTIYDLTKTCEEAEVQVVEDCEEAEVEDCEEAEVEDCEEAEVEDCEEAEVEDCEEADYDLKMNPWISAIGCVLFDVCKTSSDRMKPRTVLNMMRHFLELFPAHVYPEYAVGALLHIINSRIPDLLDFKENLIRLAFSKSEIDFSYDWPSESHILGEKICEYELHDVFTLQYYVEFSVDSCFEDVLMLENYLSEKSVSYDEASLEGNVQLFGDLKSQNFDYMRTIGDSVTAELFPPHLEVPDTVKRLIGVAKRNVENEILKCHSDAKAEFTGKIRGINGLETGGNSASIKTLDKLADEVPDSRALGSEVENTKINGKYGKERNGTSGPKEKGENTEKVLSDITNQMTGGVLEKQKERMVFGGIKCNDNTNSEKKIAKAVSVALFYNKNFYVPSEKVDFMKSLLCLARSWNSTGNPDEQLNEPPKKIQKDRRNEAENTISVEQQLECLDLHKDMSDINGEDIVTEHDWKSFVQALNEFRSKEFFWTYTLISKTLIRQMITAVITLEKMYGDLANEKKATKSKHSNNNWLKKKERNSELLKLLHKKMGLLMLSLAKFGTEVRPVKSLLTKFCVKQALYHIDEGSLPSKDLTAFAWYLAGISQSFLLPPSFDSSNQMPTINHLKFEDLLGDQEPHLQLLCKKFRKLDQDRYPDKINGLKSLAIDIHPAIKQAQVANKKPQPPQSAKQPQLDICMFEWFNSSISQQPSPVLLEFLHHRMAIRVTRMGYECFLVLQDLQRAQGGTSKIEDPIKRILDFFEWVSSRPVDERCLTELKKYCDQVNEFRFFQKSAPRDYINREAVQGLRGIAQVKERLPKLNDLLTDPQVAFNEVFPKIDKAGSGAKNLLD